MLSRYASIQYFLKRHTGYARSLYVLLEKTSKKKNEKTVDISHAIAHIQSNRRNTIITITDLKGNTKTWSSSGTLGFKGSRRSTNYASQATAENVARVAIQMGIKSVKVRIKGLSYGKELALRGLLLGGLLITKICDITPIPHNGCRPPSLRRV